MHHAEDDRPIVGVGEHVAHEAVGRRESGFWRMPSISFVI